jgi:hypothetical protein
LPRQPVEFDQLACLQVAQRFVHAPLLACHIQRWCRLADRAGDHQEDAQWWNYCERLQGARQGKRSNQGCL